MRGHWLPHWTEIAERAEAAMQGDDIRDIAAVGAAHLMADAIRHGRRMPQPTPQLSAQLARAEALAAKA